MTVQQTQADECVCLACASVGNSHVKEVVCDGLHLPGEEAPAETDQAGGVGVLRTSRMWPGAMWLRSGMFASRRAYLHFGVSVHVLGRVCVLRHPAKTCVCSIQSMHTLLLMTAAGGEG